MAWHEDLALEVYVEFQRLTGIAYERYENTLWYIRKYADFEWAEHGKWWRKTTVGRRYFREWQAKKAALLKSSIVAIRGCIACGKPFELNAYREQRGRDRVCSNECRGAARQNIKLVTIGGRSMPLVRWAEEHGLAITTVWARIDRGWTVERAVSTPAANRGQGNRKGAVAA